MPPRARHRLSQIVLVSLALATIAPGSSARASEAAPPPDRRVTVEIEAWSAALRGQGLDFAYVDDTGGLSGGGRVVTLDAERDLLPRVAIAYRFGGASIGARFWESAAGGQKSTGLVPQRVGALLASPDFAISRSLVDSASGSVRSRLTVADVGVGWERPVDRATLAFEAGLRFFRFEQDTTIVYDADNFGSPLEEILVQSSDTRGIGPRAALTFGYRFGERVRVSGGLGAAYIAATTSSLATDSSFLDNGGQLELDRSTVVDRPSSHVGIPTLDLDMAIDIRVAPVLSVFAAYRATYAAEVVTWQRFVDDLSQNSSVMITGDATVEGVALGLRFEY